MYVVLFHYNNLYYFIGIASSYDRAEDLIAADEDNIGKADKPCYAIVKVPVNSLEALNIADYVEGQPYKRGE